MQSTNLKNAINDFNNLKQVTELLEISLKGKSKVSYSLEIFEEADPNSILEESLRLQKKVIISLDVEKSQGYSGYRQIYIL